MVLGSQDWDKQDFSNILWKADNIGYQKFDWTCKGGALEESQWTPARRISKCFTPLQIISTNWSSIDETFIAPNLAFTHLIVLLNAGLDNMAEKRTALSKDKLMSLDWLACLRIVSHSALHAHQAVQLVFTVKKQACASCYVLTSEPWT